MALEFPVAEMLAASIRTDTSFERLSVGQPSNAQQINELDEPRGALIEDQTPANSLQDENRRLDEDNDYLIMTVTRHEKEILRLDENIRQLREEIEELRNTVTIQATQLEQTQNELVETRNNLTIQLEQTQNELVETRNNLAAQLEQTQSELVETRNNHATQSLRTQNELAELREIVNQLRSNLAN